MGSRWGGQGNYQGDQDVHVVLWEAEAQAEVSLAAAIRTGKQGSGSSLAVC